jgi:ribosome-associated protein
LKSSASLAYYISNAALNKKAMDVRILNVSHLSPIADYFVVCSGTSTVQVKAIADEIEEKLSEKGFYVRHKEGYNSARWVLLDYGDIIVHVFYTEDRDFYDIERLWADAIAVNV